MVGTTFQGSGDMRLASRTFTSIVDGRMGSTCGSLAQYMRACVARSNQLLPMMPLSDGVWPGRSTLVERLPVSRREQTSLRRFAMLMLPKRTVKVF